MINYLLSTYINHNVAEVKQFLPYYHLTWIQVFLGNIVVKKLITKNNDCPHKHQRSIRCNVFFCVYSRRLCRVYINNLYPVRQRGSCKSREHEKKEIYIYIHCHYVQSSYIIFHVHVCKCVQAERFWWFFTYFIARKAYQDAVILCRADAWVIYANQNEKKMRCDTLLFAYNAHNVSYCVSTTLVITMSAGNSG